MHMMEMDHYADAIVGVPGEGLNIEQRKRLTIAIEMAATPDVVLFLDEPTSGLDSQTAWSICTLLRKLADEGQAILCTIHQPSSQLFSMFDRVLLLGAGGNTLYFGDIGSDASSVIGYFEEHGAPKCQKGENPAEWLLAVTRNISDAESSQSPKDWPQIWQTSCHKQEIFRAIESQENQSPHADIISPSQGHEEFATSLFTQLYLVTHRVFVEQWRDPSSGFFLSRHPNTSRTDLVPGIGQRHILLQQLARHPRRDQFIVFVFLDNSVVQLHQPAGNPALLELTWQTIISVPVFASWYYPIGLYRDGSSTYSTTERGAICFVIIWFFNLWANTLSQSFAAGIQHAETVVQAATLCFWLSLVFCG
ncbi:hypothetical protein F5Y07DRAFT_348834 [Xylaria sp. FL0933]|nr:hypothetical protein F5Y07DRAFT_348834 [Xylaria sp. FL0933]